MSIDVFSYFANMYAESVKDKGEEMSRELSFILHSGIPAFSLGSLMAVTIWILVSAVDIIINPPSEDDSVDVNVMYGFAAVNFVIDLLASMMFYCNLDTALYSTSNDDTTALNTEGLELSQIKSKEAAIEEKSYLSFSYKENEERLGDVETSQAVIGDSAATENEEVEEEGRVGKKCNLNMLSALSHVGADTLRTFAIFVGAAVGSSGIDSAVADAWAAIVCSLTIMITILPLYSELYTSIKEHFSTVPEEQYDAVADAGTEDAVTA